jgi:hypothetical protein
MTGLPCTCGSRTGCERHGPEPRERDVPCVSCSAPTWNVSALCDQCLEREAKFSAVRRGRGSANRVVQQAAAEVTRRRSLLTGDSDDQEEATG